MIVYHAVRDTMDKGTVVGRVCSAKVAVLHDTAAKPRDVER